MEAELKGRIQAQALPLLGSARAQRVVVWGAGEVGSWLMEQLGERGLAFVDANPTKRGAVIAGREVHAPEDLVGLEFDEVWIAVLSDTEAVAQELRSHGLEEGRGYRCPFPGGKLEQVLDLLPRWMEFLGRADLRDAKVLEVGFGGQLFLSLACLWRGARSVTLTDVSAQGCPLERDRASWLGFLSVLQERFPKQRLHARDPQAMLDCLHFHPEPTGAGSLPFGAGSFDAVVNTGVMEHIDDPEAAIGDFARVLRAGGKVLAAAIGIHDHRSNDPAADFHPWSFCESSAEDWKALGSGAYHQNRWRAVDFERAFVRHGFQLLHTEATADARFRPAFLAAMDPAFREGYTEHELAELDQYLIAVKAAGRA